jgi:hypothetical protein
MEAGSIWMFAADFCISDAEAEQAETSGCFLICWLPDFLKNNCAGISVNAVECDTAFVHDTYTL